MLAHHALVAGLAQAAFRHSLVVGREALCISAVNEAIIHLELAHRFVQETSLAEIPDKAELRNLYKQLVRAYELNGRIEKALALAAERD